MDTVPDMWHVSDTCPTRVDTCPLLTLLLGELQGSVRGQIGVEFRQESNEHGPRHVTRVQHVSLTISAFRWATEECEGSKWGGISPGIQWTRSQIGNTCLTLVNTCPLQTHLPDELKGSVRGQNGVEFTRNSMDMVPDTWYVSFTNSASRWDTGECEGSKWKHDTRPLCVHHQHVSCVNGFSN